MRKTLFTSGSPFAGGRITAIGDFTAVTLAMSIWFVGAGRLGVPLTAEVELVREDPLVGDGDAFHLAP